MDPLNKSQQIDTRARGKIALEELAARLAGIKRQQARFTSTVLGGTVLWWVLLFAWTRDVQKANYVFTNSFQFLAVAWCTWFMYPYFLRVEAKQDVSLAMGHDSVDTLERVSRTIDERVEKVDVILQRLNAMTEEAEAAGMVKKALDAVDQLKGDMAAIRAKLVEERTPLKLKRRPEDPQEVAAGEHGRGHQD